MIIIRHALDCFSLHSFADDLTENDGVNEN